MAKFVLKRERVDRVWVIPCFKHPFAKPLVSFPHRLKMCRLSFKGFKKRVKILDIEKKLGGKSYTFRTVAFLQKKFPQKKFFLIVGKDIVKQAKRWHGYRKLKKEVDWLILPRGPKSPIPNVSATHVRKALKEERGLMRLIPKNVIEYIGENRLYKKR